LARRLVARYARHNTIMRVLLINTTEVGGGAAIATSRLKEALIDNGVKAKLLVRDKETQSLSTVGLGGGGKSHPAFLWERLSILLANRLSRHHLFDIDIANAGTDVTKLREFKEADIIHLNWINQGMLSIKDLRRILDSGKPIVWTMHDMWEFTGICHYVGDCERYKTGCCECPLLKHPGRHDLSARIYHKKQKLLEGRRIEFVAVSHWLARLAGESRLLRRHTVSVIPNALSVNRFSLKDRTSSRRLLGLPAQKIICFGAVKIDDPRKGFKYLKEALQILIEQGTYKREEMHLVLFGQVKDETVLEDIPVEYTYLGYVADDDQLSTIYAASDVAVIPSLYETFGQTVMEAQACGCLPVTFGGSGQEDIIEHQQNGYLAQYCDAQDLARGIQYAFSSSPDPQMLRANVVKRYSEDVVAHKYIEIYNRLTHSEA
jgi:glycosyltransferase involved in cell wall biosynthesis